jgi:hypothetical protein
MFSARLPLRTALALLVIAGSAALVIAERTGWAPQLSLPVSWLLEWAVVLAGVALVIGVLNVLWVHLRRIQRGQAGWDGSLLLVVVLVAVAVAGLANPAGERSPLVEWAFDALIRPGAATLFALIAVFLLAVIFHQVRVGRPGGAWVAAGLLLMLTIQTPAARMLLSSDAAAWASWLIDVPMTATFRGALLGMALALLVVGVRMVIRRRR